MNHYKWFYYLFISILIALLVPFKAFGDETVDDRMERIIEEYMNVKDALIHNRDDLSAGWAERLETSIATMPHQIFDDDILPDVEGYQAVMLDAAGNIVDAESIDDQREALRWLSADLMELIELVGNPGEPIYVFACDAFADEPSVWLSHSMQVANPFLGPPNLEIGTMVGEL